MKGFLLLLLVSALGCGLVGCKGGESAVVGKWKGEVKVGGSPDDPGAKLAEAFGSLMSMDLELKADHTFNLSMMMMPVGGNWSMSGNSVTLTPTTVMGLSKEEFEKKSKEKGGSFSKSPEADKPIVLQLQSDGTMVGQDENTSSSANKSKLVFTRKS